MFERLIRDDFKGVPNDLDAAFYWESLDKTYVFKDDKYYEISIFEYGQNYQSEPISDWNDILRNIDAALEYEGHILFFEDNKIFELDALTLSVNFL